MQPQNAPKIVWRPGSAQAHSNSPAGFRGKEEEGRGEEGRKQGEIRGEEEERGMRGEKREGDSSLVQRVTGPKGHRVRV